jgi:ABC-2 type transport system permease protein
MQTLYAIYRKEMGHYFVSPIAYVVIGLFILLCGFLFDVYLSSAIQNSFQAQMQAAQYGMPADFDVSSAVLMQFFGVLATFILFFTPMLTMGVYAEERKRGTMELLMTSPVTELQIVLGKFFATLTLFVLMLLPTTAYMIFLFAHSEPAAPWRVLLGAYLGIFLLGASLLALGTFVSSLTENQLIAAVLSFAAILVIWLSGLGGNDSTTLGSVLSYVSLIGHYDDFPRGVIDTSAVVYYVSFIVLFVFLTVRSVDSMRWRRA